MIEAKNGSDKANRYLIRRYQSMVHTIINKGFFLKSGNRDDLIAEGLIGLSRAINDFDETKGNSDTFDKNLENFFYMCIHRSLISAIKSSNRKKNGPLNDMTSFDRPLLDNESLTAMDVIASSDEIRHSFGVLDPEEQLILEESLERYKKMLDEDLSDAEKEIRDLRLKKYSYKEIQEILGYDKAKPIDNALQRAKSKLNHIIEQEERRARDMG